MSKTADIMIVIKSVADKPAPAMGDGDEGFVPPKDLGEGPPKHLIKEPGEGSVNPISQSELKEFGEKAEKKAQAYDWGVRFALAERGLHGPAQDLAVKVAAAISDGSIAGPQDIRPFIKQAANPWGEPDDQFRVGDWITDETKDLHPLVKLLLLTGGGAALGAGAGALGDKALEIGGRKPSNALTLLGALTGGGLGAYKHVRDQIGPIPGYADRTVLR